MIIPQANRLNQVQEYYFSLKLEEIRRMNTQGPQVLNLGIGNPDLSPSETTLKKLCESSLQPGHHGYQSYRGIPQFREALAQWYKRTYEVDLDYQNEVLPLIGSKEGIMHISMAFLNEGDEVLVPNPGYPTYRAVSDLVGANVLTYALDENQGWQIDISALEKMNLKNVKLMWINFPNMPTGARGSLSQFEALIRLAEANKFLIVNDNPYSLILNESPISLLSVAGAKSVALELNSLSKSHNMAGWRLGCVCGASDYINTILKVKSNMDSGMFLPLQHAAIEALNNDARWHRQQNNQYKLRRNAVRKLLDMLGCSYEKEQSGLFVWAKIPQGIADLSEFVDKILYGARVFVTPGFIFGSLGDRYVRVSLCNDVSVIEEALARIQKNMIASKIKAS